MVLGTLSFIVGGVLIGLAIFIPIMWFILWLGKKKIKKKIAKYFEDINSVRKAAESELNRMIDGC